MFDKQNEDDNKVHFPAILCPDHAKSDVTTQDDRIQMVHGSTGPIPDMGSTSLHLRQCYHMVYIDHFSRGRNIFGRDHIRP